MYEKLTKQFEVSKTLRIGLKPTEQTTKNIADSGIIEEAKEVIRCKDVSQAVVDRALKKYLSERLSTLSLNITAYKAEFASGNKDKKGLFAQASALRNTIADCLKDGTRYKTLFVGKNNFISTARAEATEEESPSVEYYERFAADSKDYEMARVQLFDHMKNANAIASRIVDDNLPIYLENAARLGLYESAGLLSDNLSELIKTTEYADIMDMASDDYAVFTADAIMAYNTLIGGIVSEDKHIKGINQLVNEHNQHLEPGEKRLPLLKPLKKQIMFEASTPSFKIPKLESDEEALALVRDLVSRIDPLILGNGSGLVSHVRNIDEYSLRRIYIDARSVTDLAKAVCGDWGIITNCLKMEYDALNPKKAAKKTKKYYEDKDKYVKEASYYSIDRLNGLVRTYGDGEDDYRFEDYYKKLIIHGINAVTAYEDARAAAAGLINGNYKSNRELLRDDMAKRLLNALLTTAKSLSDVFLTFVDSKEEMDAEFYAPIEEVRDILSEVTDVFNKVRNYVTKKPYETSMIELYFGTPTLLEGWDTDHIDTRLSVIIRKGNEYYLCILKNSKEYKKFFNAANPPSDETDVCEVMRYKQVPTFNKNAPRVLLLSGKLESYGITVPDRIREIYESKSFKNNSDIFSKEDLTELIDYYKYAFSLHPSYSCYKFTGSKPSSEYESIDEFYDDIENNCYLISFEEMSYKNILKAEEAGGIYRFRIWSKDESEHHKGKDSPMTMYFRQLFAPENLSDPSYKLLGGAAMYFRAATLDLKTAVVHKANEPIQMRHGSEERNTSLYHYDIIKDRRFAYDHFELHLPVKCNYGCPDENDTVINQLVDDELRSCENVNVLGIKRGEGNLLYVTVIDGTGKILLQKSLNEISDGNGHSADYAEILYKREQEIADARQTWTTIGSAQDLKKGYLSLCVGEILRMAIKYDAVIAMEALDTAFKDSRRIKIAKNIYSPFEEALVKKLSFAFLKDAAKGEPGSISNPYQLAAKTNLDKTRRSGILFLVPPSFTESVDPTTGYVPHARTASKITMAAAKEHIGKFSDISFDEHFGCIKLTYDYRSFTDRDRGSRFEWTLYGTGSRSIERKDPINGTSKLELVDLKDEFKELFRDYGLDLKSSTLKEDILAQTKGEFFTRFMELLNAVQQMKNYRNGESFLTSPVPNERGEFFNTLRNDSVMPECADANGSYNIARKGLMTVESIRNGEVNPMYPTDGDWFTYMREHLV